MLGEWRVWCVTHGQEIAAACGQLAAEGVAERVHMLPRTR
jgi:hypothetical protein